MLEHEAYFLGSTKYFMLLLSCSKYMPFYKNPNLQETLAALPALPVAHLQSSKYLISFKNLYWFYFLYFLGVKSNKCFPLWVQVVPSSSSKRKLLLSRGGLWQSSSAVLFEEKPEKELAKELNILLNATILDKSLETNWRN